MWPPVSPMRSSTSGGPSTSRCTIDSATSGAKRLIGRDGVIGDLLASSLPRPGGELERDVLGEDAHDVTALGDDRGVVGALEVELAPRRVRLAAPARLVGGLGGVDPGADGDHGPVRLDVGPGRREMREPAQRAVDLEHRALAPPGRDPSAEVVGDAVLAQGHGPFRDRRWTPRPGPGSSPRPRDARPRRAPPRPPARRRPARRRPRWPRRPARTTPAPCRRRRIPTPRPCPRRSPRRA